MNIPQLVKEKILEIDKNAEVILFGSRARGDFHEESDWDFLVLLDEKGSVSRSKKSDLRNHLFDLQLDTLQCISLIVKNKEEWGNYINTSLYRNIKKEGVFITEIEKIIASNSDCLDD